MRNRDIRGRISLYEEKSAEIFPQGRAVREKKSDDSELQVQGINSLIVQRRARNSALNCQTKDETETKKGKNRMAKKQEDLASDYCQKTNPEKIVAENNISFKDEDSKNKMKFSADVIAEILKSLYQFRRKNNQLYHFDKDTCSWEILEPSLENRELRALIPRGERGSISKGSLSEVFEWLFIDSPELEANPKSKEYLNFRDCSVNWKTEKIVTDIKERKKLNFTYFIDVDYQGLDKSRDSYHEFTEFVFGNDAATLKEFHKFVGLALSEFRNLKMACFLYGPSNTGKSVVLNLLKLLVGKNRCSSVSFSQLGENFALTRLLGKRLNISGEVSGTGNKKLDVFKSLTGNDDVEICFKSRDYFTYVNECMFVFACNNFPAILSVPEFESYLSRIFFFPFQNVRQRESWVEGLEYELYQDAYSVIKAAMQGLRDLEQDHFRLVETARMEECKHEYRGLFDSFTLFAENHILADRKSKVSSRAIREAYSQFCAEEDYQTLDINTWSQILKQKYGCSSCTMNTICEDGGTKRERAYKGIRLVSGEIAGA